jgi:hypothetical protein
MSARGEVEYCQTWNWRQHRPGVSLSEADARALDAQGEQFIAVLRPVGERQPVLVTVSWQTDCITATFFDDHARMNLKYWFFKVDDSRMFLRDVSVYDYPNDEPRLRQGAATRLEQLQYREDGYAHRTLINKTEQYKDTSEFRDVPVQKNWEPVPAFGDYCSIARRERGDSPVSRPADRASG